MKAGSPGPAGNWSSASRRRRAPERRPSSAHDADRPVAGCGAGPQGCPGGRPGTAVHLLGGRRRRHHHLCLRPLRAPHRIRHTLRQPAHLHRPRGRRHRSAPPPRPLLRPSPLRPRQALATLRRRAAETGLPRIGVHDLRHTAATIMISSGVPPTVVPKTLRHSTLSTTVNLYGHLLPHAARDAVRAPGRAPEGADRDHRPTGAVQAA
ncbi:tyrosine-type recombinase/integrase [Streptomyces desertarenae]|uniref:Tyrosine-type recombinase/integrase n=1 Tax=Streptomyces desertarenae TaxID=2666184 RepID=A0ABW4PI32_9ACTN